MNLIGLSCESLNMNVKRISTVREKFILVVLKQRISAFFAYELK